MNETPQRQDTQETTVDLGRMFVALLDHKWLIVFITLLFAGLGYVQGQLATPIYQANALVQVERRSSVSPFGNVGSVIGDDMLNTPAEVQILQSRMVLGQVVDRLERDVIIQPVELPVIGNFVERRQIPRPEFMVGQPHVWGDESLDVARFELADNRRGQRILVERLQEGYQVLLDDVSIGRGQIGQVERFLDDDLILRIERFEAAPGARFRLMKQHRTSAIGNISSRLQITQSTSEPTAGMLRLLMVGDDPVELTRTLDAVAETFLTQNVERQSAQAQQSLEFLEDQAPELRSQLAEAEQRLNEYRSNLDSVDLDSESQAAIQRYIELETRLNDLEFQEAELAQRYTPSHPTYQSLLRQREQIQQDREELNDRVDQLPAAQQQVIRLRRDMDVTQAIYVNVLNKMQELEVARAGTIGNVRIIDDAVVSGLVAPKRGRILILATLLGLVLSVGLVLMRELLRRGVTSPEQIEAAGIPVYATIPLSSGQTRLTKRVRRRAMGTAKNVVTGVLAEREPADLSVEAVRGLRTSLHFALLEGCNNRIMITGSSPGVGKSFLGINLASVFAQAGKRVVLVDADLRKGYVHRAFKLDASPGLSDYLSGQCDLADIIRPTGIENYHVISRGRVAPNPSELLMQSRLAAAMEALSDMFDLVLVDTPPILAVTDASILGKHCDTTLLVARFEKNPVREIKAARRRLEDSGIRVRGAVLNAVELKPSTASGYYGHYQYQYR
ncbi:polysaccharide biosynthesis tyrosine autokinase [Halomonas sp. LR5S13]|uniref:polysaccharide biosynthesis tyrosine autokinase n=1 Tax=Halomonas rhizosphaerae TaxID=3043296 RepID=UPI0024A7AE14|nr:polysaccharide biosynthesis tyrosine autokinase [Halomonas rhizosphaerae]MDI5921868.1 polysaccharide biosynthesis tyrosine autokinase [Halomonas rhizosphaerae]